MMHIINDIKNIKSGKKELREFGLVVGGVLLALGSVMIMRGKPLAPYFMGLGFVLIPMGLAAPKALIPLQKIWMAFAVIMGFVMSRVVLTILYYMVVTPIGLIMKMLGKDILDEHIDKRSPSYWKELPKEAKAKESYEKQF
jgi:hypothetical protein